MSFRNALTLSVAAGILATVSVLPAFAGTFAQFNQQSGANAFSLTGAATPGQVLSSTVPVFFNFQNVAGNPTFTQPVPFSTDIMGMLTFNAVSSGATTTSGGLLIEPFSTASWTFKVMGNQTFGAFTFLDGQNLLTGTSVPSVPGNTTGSLSGTPGGNSATFGGSDAPPVGPLTNTVTFTSDFINYTGASSKAYGFSFSSVFMNYSAGPGGTVAPFTAAGTGTFSAISGVPEPGAVAMLAGLGVTGSLFAFRRLRRRR